MLQGALLKNLVEYSRSIRKSFYVCAQAYTSKPAFLFLLNFQEKLFFVLSTLDLANSLLDRAVERLVTGIAAAKKRHLLVFQVDTAHLLVKMEKIFLKLDLAVTPG